MRSMPTGGAQTVEQTRGIIHIDMDAFSTWGFKITCCRGKCRACSTGRIYLGISPNERGRTRMFSDRHHTTEPRRRKKCDRHP